MAVIALEGMKFYAYHGVYEAEKVIGTDYIVDVYVQTAIVAAAAKTDKLESTINYEAIYQICKMQMGKQQNLLEKVVHEIIKAMKNQFADMMALKVRIRKLNPPLGGRVEQAWVEEEEAYMQTCPKCNKQFINYAPDACWERFPNLHPATKETLLRQFNNKCLCNDCLKFYAG